MLNGQDDHHDDDQDDDHDGDQDYDDNWEEVAHNDVDDRRNLPAFGRIYKWRANV